MAAVVAVVGAIIGGIAVWWWRAQQVKGAADSVIDAAGKARGMISRARFRQRAGQSVLAGVDSPGMAAATLLYSLSSASPWRWPTRGRSTRCSMRSAG